MGWFSRTHDYLRSIVQAYPCGHTSIILTVDDSPRKIIVLIAWIIMLIIWLATAIYKTWFRNADD
jgi:hypothetical protein